MKALNGVLKHRHALLAVLCTALAAVFLLLALDLRTWRTTVTRDDIRFRALPAHRGLWRPTTILPGDPAGNLLGIGDTIRFRRALQSFWYSRIGSDPETRQDLPTLRATAQARLQSLISSTPRRADRSGMANLLGVLVVTAPATGSGNTAISQTLQQAATYFQLAIAIDPSNADAKQNLELVLRLRRPGKGTVWRDARSGYGFGRGHATGTTGSGY